MDSSTALNSSRFESPPSSGPALGNRDGIQVVLTRPRQLESVTFKAAPLRWLTVLRTGLGHEPYLVEARDSRENVLAQLPLCFVQSRLFGRYLVSLPYINSSGVLGRSKPAAQLVVNRAVDLAEELDCRFLELRHETVIEHPALTKTVSEKVHMRRELPGSVAALRERLKAKVRNQVKKGENQGFTVRWGRHERLADFYTVFSRNMRDLGTPVFGRKLFEAILEGFPDEAEICSVRDGRQPLAAGLLIHGREFTEVPSASSLRSANKRNPNMLLYYHLLARAVERGQRGFDFGRSTPDGPTYRFKKQWGAEPSPANWQYHVRQGDAGAVRPNNPKYKLLIRTWRRLPLWFANCLGPPIVRGIP